MAIKPTLPPLRCRHKTFSITAHAGITGTVTLPALQIQPLYCV
jgi:hypothetical protein